MKELLTVDDVLMAGEVDCPLKHGIVAIEACHRLQAERPEDCAKRRCQWQRARTAFGEHIARARAGRGKK